MTTLVLASASPRRRELLALLGLPFEVSPADLAEPMPEQTRRPERVARALARAKAQAIAARYPRAVVLAADTVVCDRGYLLGKPADEAEAWALLRRLRGRRHRVITAVAVARGQRLWVSHAVTWVQMRCYQDDEIAGAIARGEPFDKAGGYAIQDPLFRPVRCFRGCYCNVVGLPLALVERLLLRAHALPRDWIIEPRQPACTNCPLYGASPVGGLQQPQAMKDQNKNEECPENEHPADTGDAGRDCSQGNSHHEQGHNERRVPRRRGLPSGSAV